jgi:uncharacterized protein (UPF0333 family)
MESSQRGFVWLPILTLLGLIVVGGGAYLVMQILHTSRGNDSITSTQTATNTGAAVPVTVLNQYYKKDADQVYFNNVPIKGADSKKFVILNGKYANDGRDFNYLGGAIVSELDDPTWDVSSYEILSSKSASYARDKNHYYFNGVSITNAASSSSFYVMNDNYAKDTRQVYYRFGIVNGADPLSFVLASSQAVYDAQDKNHKYLNGQIVQ